MRVAAVVSIMVLAGSCSVVHKFEYQPPEQLEALARYERVIDSSFDDAWDALISSIGRSFFAIDEFEKASGLLTLSFTTSPFSDAIDGGQCKFLYDNSQQVQGAAFWAGVHSQATKIKFEGNYADFIERYRSGAFSGRMNLVVREESPGKTRITVNTRFSVVATVADKTGNVQKVTWSWNSGDRARRMVTNHKGESVPRFMQSNHYVERKILDAIDELFKVKQ